MVAKTLPYFVAGMRQVNEVPTSQCRVCSQMIRYSDGGGSRALGRGRFGADMGRGCASMVFVCGNEDLYEHTYLATQKVLPVSIRWDFLEVTIVPIGR